MKLFKSLESLLNSESRARRYLSEKCWQNKVRFCIRCGSKKIYRLADKRYRCARCRYTFQEFAGRWIAELKITAVQWLWTLKLFELEVTPNRIAEEIGISYPTVLKATRSIRHAILQQYLSGKPRAGESFWHKVLIDLLGKNQELPSGKEPTVFAIEERNGVIEVAPARDIATAALGQNRIVASRVGQLLYAGRSDKKRALVFWGGRRLTAAPENLLPPRGRPAERGSVGDFLVFVQDRMGRSPRVTRRQFPLYLMEMKFRYDHRSRDQFDLLATAIAQLVPRR